MAVVIDTSGGGCVERRRRRKWRGCGLGTIVGAGGVLGGSEAWSGTNDIYSRYCGVRVIEGSQMLGRVQALTDMARYLNLEFQ